MKKIISCGFVFINFFLFAQQKDSIQNIQQIDILVKKKLLERKADRLIFNVEASIASQGMDAVETIANVPMMKIDENMGSVSIAGKSSVSVMVDGKMLNLSGNSLINYLKSIRSENIAKIELITTPPAKYEAQGNSGLVNIILKKNPNIGFSGNFNSTLIQRTYSGFSDNLALNYQTEKMSSSLKLNYYDSAKRSDENYTILGESQSYSSSIRRDMWWELSPNLSLSYKVGKRSEIGFNYILAHQKPGMDIENTTKNIDKNFEIENLITKTADRQKMLTQTANLYYDLKLDSLGKKISISANYYLNDSKTNVRFSTLKTTDQSVTKIQTVSLLKPSVFSVQGDLELPFSFGTFETGLKFNQFRNVSDLKYFNIIDGKFVSDDSRANIFNYQEENYAAYVSFAKNFGENWSTKTGLRYEDSFTNAFTPSTNERTKYNYGQWFPSAFVSYKNKKNTFSFSYSRRINRPSMNNLNPFRWYDNPYSYSSGNPLLQPSYINNLELGYTYNNKFSTSIYYLKLKNAFDQISYLNGLSKIGTYLNYYDNDFLGMNISYTEPIFPWWETSNSINVSITDSSVFNIEATPKKGKTFEYSTNNTFALNKKKTIALFLNYSQTLAYENVNSHFHNFSNLTSGFKFSLLENQLQINATITNILAQRYKGDMYFTSNSQHFNNYWDGRSLRLSVNYTFGNNKVKSRTKSVNFEEKDRLN